MKISGGYKIHAISTKQLKSKDLLPNSYQTVPMLLGRLIHSCLDSQELQSLCSVTVAGVLDGRVHGKKRSQLQVLLVFRMVKCMGNKRSRLAIQVKTRGVVLPPLVEK